MPSKGICQFLAKDCGFHFQREGKNDRRKYFMVNLHERLKPTRQASEASYFSMEIYVVGTNVKRLVPKAYVFAEKREKYQYF